MNTISLPKHGLRLLAFSSGLLLTQTLQAAVGFTVSPAMVSNTYSGNITLQITGLSNGESVVVQKFLDANSNGVIDGADLLWQQFALTDGQVSVLGGVTNINVPGDADPMPGQITARVIFRNSDPVLNVVGKYAFKLSVPSATNWFTITNTSYAQSLTGNVVNHGTNVPNAVVMVFAPEPGDNGPGSTLGGTVANGLGGFEIQVPPGVYSAVAFKSNYLGYLRPLPVVVSSGMTVNTNLILTNATRVLSGKLVDAANSTTGLPGMFGHADDGELVSVVSSDANGNFTFPVGSGHWNVGAVGLEALGYINVDADVAAYDTTTGSVSGLMIAFPKANALFYGRILDEQGQPLAGVRMDAENDDYDHWSDAYTDANGNYVVGALAGEPWDVDVDDDELNVANYLFPSGTTTNLSLGQALRQDFTALLATNHITGHLQDDNGIFVSNVEVYAYAIIGGRYYSTGASTDANGNYSLNVANGNWGVGVGCGGDDWNPLYCCPNTQNVTISGANGVADFVLSGHITAPSLLPEGYVGDSYSFQFDAVACMLNLIWSATNPPSGLSLSPNGNLSGTPDTAGSNYFFVRVDDGFGHSTAKAFSLVVYHASIDVTLYYVNKLRAYRQTNAVNLVPDNIARPYHAVLGIFLAPAGSVSNASVSLPTSEVIVFPNPDISTLTELDYSFTNETSFDTLFPAGSYSFAMSTANNGNQFPVLDMPPPAYPNAPHISNYAAAQSINPASAFLLQWDAFANGATNDPIWLLVSETNGVEVFSTPYPPLDFENSLRGTATSVSIPVGAFQAGRTYLGTIVFFKVMSINTLDYFGAFGVTLASAQTVFSLATASAAPTLSQPSRPSATQFRFLLTGLAGQPYTILKSTNLNSTNWSILLVTNAPAVVIDSAATNSHSFYRALSGP